MTSNEYGTGMFGIINLKDIINVQIRKIYRLIFVTRALPFKYNVIRIVLMIKSKLYLGKSEHFQWKSKSWY